MRSFLLLFSLLWIAFLPQAQELTQNVRGQVIDRITREPLPGANIVLLNSNPLKGVTSDANGRWVLESVPAGRVGLKISFIGYQEVLMPSLFLSTGKELYLTVEMEEMAFNVKEVEIVADQDKTQTLNPMTTVSARSFTIEETQRYAGSRNDVARMATNFAGVKIGTAPERITPETAEK